MASRLLLIVGVALVVSSCTIINAPRQQTPKTQLQVREFQTREFDTNDTKLVMKAVLNVLQDEGFVVKNAVVDLGLITAVKELQISGQGTSGSNNDFWDDMLEQLFRSKHGGRSTQQEDPRFNKFKTVEVSVNVTEYGSRSRVRANFLAKILDNKGDPAEVYTIDDPKFYQDFFSKVDKGVFLQKQGL